MAAKKTTKPATKAKTSTAAAAPAAPEEVSYNLDQLHQALGAPSSAITTVLLGSRTDDDFLALGTSFASSDILDSAPRFLGTAHAYYASSTSAARKRLIGISPDVFALAVSESITLRGKLREFRSSAGASAATRRDKLRATVSESRAKRDQVLSTLGGVVSAKGKLRDKLDASAGPAPTPEEVAVALDTLSDVVTLVLKSATDETRSAYSAIGIDEALAASLQAQAKTLREADDVANGGDPNKSVNQRDLDLQDGRVLHVITHIYRAFREAHGVSATVVVPPLGKLRRIAGNLAPRKPATPRATP
jgi:hypothetical protein